MQTVGESPTYDDRGRNVMECLNAKGIFLQGPSALLRAGLSKHERSPFDKLRANGIEGLRAGSA